MEAGMSRLSTNSALEATRMKLALLDADVRHLLLPGKCCCSESSTHETAFLEMARYNAWANVRLYKMAGALPEELYRREIVSFIQFVLWHIRCGKSKCHDRKDPLATRSHLSYCCKLCSLDGHCHTTVKILHPFEGNSPTADTLLHLARGRMRFQHAALEQASGPPCSALATTSRAVEMPRQLPWLSRYASGTNEPWVKKLKAAS